MMRALLSALLLLAMVGVSMAFAPTQSSKQTAVSLKSKIALTLFFFNRIPKLTLVFPFRFSGLCS